MTNFGERVAAWAARQRSIDAVVLIGSRTRQTGDVTKADDLSDWDFHVITSQPDRFLNRDWTAELGLGPALAYGARRGAVGGVTRVTALFPEIESDYVVLSSLVWNAVRLGLRLGLHRRVPSVRRRATDLALIVRPGHRVLHGGKRWANFYRRVVDCMQDPRLGDADACRLAERFVCDYIWLQRKIARGELLAAQRMLHHSLAEINFQLLHECRLRRGEPTFPEARRIERVLDGATLDRVTVVAGPDSDALLAAGEKAAETCRELMRSLVGSAWRWPNLVAMPDATRRRG